MKLTKEQYDALPDSVKALFQADGDGYTKKPDEGGEDIGALKRGKDREVQARKDAEAQAAKLQADLDKLTDNDARKRGDIETLEKSWQSKIDGMEATHQEKLAKKDAFIKNALVTNVAQSIASEIAPENVSLILPHITARLTADLDGDSPVTKVVDATGSLSALSVDDLKKEFVDNKDFASIIVGSKASGSGASADKSKRVGSAAPEGKKLVELSPTELAAHISATKEQE